MLTVIRTQFRKTIRWNYRENIVVNQAGHIKSIITTYNSSSFLSHSIDNEMYTFKGTIHFREEIKY